jgi:hypothetical protein
MQRDFQIKTLYFDRCRRTPRPKAIMLAAVPATTEKFTGHPNHTFEHQSVLVL